MKLWIREALSWRARNYYFIFSIAVASKTSYERKICDNRRFVNSRLVCRTHLCIAEIGQCHRKGSFNNYEDQILTTYPPRVDNCGQFIYVLHTLCLHKWPSVDFLLTRDLRETIESGPLCITDLFWYYRLISK